MADNAYFYDPNKNFANSVNAIFSLMYCIDNLDFLKFYGNFNTDNTQSLRLELYTCASDPTNKNCKNPKDLIKAGKWPYFLTLTNNQQY